MQQRFQNKVALVTGASSGIGAATALRLAQEGASLVITGRKSEPLQDLQSQLEAAGSEVLTKVVDLLDFHSIQSLIDDCVARFSRLDVLVNAAGIIGSGSVETTSLEQWEAMFGINATAPFLLMQSAMPHLKKSRGAVVNVSSVTGVRSFPGVLAYCASKSALDQMTHCVALEVAPDGVRVNAINPGVVVTNLHKRGGMDADAYAAFLEYSKTTHALGRVGTAEEVAALIAFLSSEEAGWITGVTIPIDGGRAQTCAR